MANRPLIGIATQSLEAIPGKLPDCWVMGQRYVRVLAEVGAVPILLPLIAGDEETLRLTYDRLDGVFLTGGVDIDPTHYGEPVHEHCDRLDPARDWVELQLIRWAMTDRKPVLGVCRGVQAINVASGGSLYQHLPEQLPTMKHDYFPRPGTPFTRDYLAHEVTLEPTTLTAQLLGESALSVNSMHHQGIKRLAPGLRATAFAQDGLIEALEGEKGFMIGVQWHPEELASKHAPQRRLFDGFLHAAGAFSR